MSHTRVSAIPYSCGMQRKILTSETDTNLEQALAYGQLWIYIMTAGQRRLHYLDGCCQDLEIQLLQWTMACVDADEVGRLQIRLKHNTRRLQDYDRYLNRLLQDIWLELRRHDSTPDFVFEEILMAWREMLPRLRAHEETLERMSVDWPEFAPSPFGYPWAML